MSKTKEEIKRKTKTTRSTKTNKTTKKTKKNETIVCGLNQMNHTCQKGIKQYQNKCIYNKKTDKCNLKKKDSIKIDFSKKNPNYIKTINVEKKELGDRLPKLDKLLKEIETITKKLWDNDLLELRPSYNSKYVKDYFTWDKIVKDKKIFKVIYDDKSSTYEVDKNGNKLDKKLFDTFSFDDKRPLMDLTTDFNTKNFWNNKKDRLNYLYLVTQVYNTMMKVIWDKKIKNKKGRLINKNNLNIMFKGGNVLRLLIKDMIDNFEVNSKKYMLSLIDNYIKIGDFDYEIISYDLPNKFITKFNMICFVIIIKLRNYLANDNYKFFNFFNLKKESRTEKVKEFLIDAQKTVDGLEKTNWFHGIKIDYVNLNEIVYGKADQDLDSLNFVYRYRTEQQLWEDPRYRKIYDITTDRESNTSYLELVDKMEAKKKKRATKRVDFVIIQDGTKKTLRQGWDTDGKFSIIKAYDMFTKLKMPKSIVNLSKKTRDDGSFLYCSHNSIVNIHNDVGHQFDISFQLNRIKYNFVMYYRKKIKGTMYYFKEDIGGEILDINHTYDNDRKKYKFKQPFNNNKYLKHYSFYDYNLDFISYSLDGMLDDVQVIIFDEVNYQPWNELKYKKRIYRVFVLYFLMFFNQYKGTSYKEKLTTIDKLIKNIKKENYKYVVKNKLLKNLFSRLGKIYNMRDTNLKKYKQYHKTIVNILNNLFKGFYNQYLVTRNQIIDIKNKKLRSSNFYLEL